MGLKEKRIGVIYGGLSSEREVSIKTGEAFVKALKAKGYTVVSLNVGKDMASDILNAKIDIALIGLHGKLGEDGTVQGLLECMGIPYTGSGVLASAVAMNKILTKQIVSTHGIATPNHIEFQNDRDAIKEVEKKITLPVVVKAQSEGSSRGTIIVREKSKLREAIEEALQYDDTLLIEDFIEGREVTCPVLDGHAYTAIEIVPKSGFYGYESKYTKGATEYILPARISEKQELEVKKNTLDVFGLLKCRGCARVDFMIDKKGKCWFIEINTLPGMTETSLVPQSAAHDGLAFNDLVEKIVLGATLDYEKIHQS